jgi:hypothetical protein
MKEREDSDRSGLKKKLVNAVALGAVALGVASLYHGKVDPYATDYQAKPNVLVAPYEVVEEKVDDADLVITYNERKNGERLHEQAAIITASEENSKRAYELMSREEQNSVDYFRQIDLSETNIDNDLLTTAVKVNYNVDLPRSSNLNLGYAIIAHHNVLSEIQELY